VCTFAVSGECLVFQATAYAGSGLDLVKVAALRPELKVLCLVEADRSISLADLSQLHDHGLVPADRDPGLVLGLQSAVFATTAKRWAEGVSLPQGLRARLLQRFVMTGIYRVGFTVESKDYSGPLTLEITAPRNGFGQRLTACEHLVRPPADSFLQEDGAGNRWVIVRYQDVTGHQAIRFHFAFKYHVDMDELLKHDLALAPGPTDLDIPSEAKGFLRHGYKIDPTMQKAIAWAAEKGSDPPDARLEFARLSSFLKQFIRYDEKKRQDYFGGRAVYSDLDLMYQDPFLTLQRKAGCCPDTVLLECAFMRACGIPCRTAGRFGHFYSEVFLRGRGWMSTSVTPTGIPLIVSPGPDHMPYQKWSPRVPLRTTNWETRIRIGPVEE